MTMICPVCKKASPLLPGRTGKQMLWGGWTCSYCKSEMNWRNKVTKENKNGLKEYEENLSKEEYIKEKARLKARKELKK